MKHRYYALCTKNRCCTPINFKISPRNRQFKTYKPPLPPPFCHNLIEKGTAPTYQVATLKQKKDLAYDRLPGRSHCTANPPTLVQKKKKKEKPNKKKTETRTQKPKKDDQPRFFSFPRAATQPADLCAGRGKE